MNPGVFDPDEDFNESMSYTDPRGACRFKHYAKHTDQYEVETIETHQFWWIAPVIFWGLALVVLLVFKSG